MAPVFEDLKWRGIIHSATDEAALQKALDTESINAYVGFDPTADSLHVGHLMQLITIARLQRAGHRPILIAGGATGMIGDPSFKATERPLLSVDVLERNVAAVQKQLARFVSFSGDNAALLLNNFDWTKNVSVIDFMREVGKHVTVNTLLSRESVRARMEDREHGISFTEMSYSLFQANDYVHLVKEYNCTLQIGGSDQWGNIVAGVDMVRRRLGKSVQALGTPLVTKADGTKFGKTVSGAPWLDAEKMSPYKLYQFWLSAEDAKVIDYLKFFTFMSREEIEDLEKQVADNPAKRAAQQRLAEEMITLIHGPEATQGAQRASRALFGDEIASLDERQLLDVFSDAPSVDCSRADLGSMSIVDALVRSGLNPSTSAARQAIAQGGVAVNNVKVETIDQVLDSGSLLQDSYVVLRRGKKNFALLRFT